MTTPKEPLNVSIVKLGLNIVVPGLLHEIQYLKFLWSIVWKERVLGLLLWCCGSICHKSYTFIQIGSVHTQYCDMKFFECYIFFSDCSLLLSWKQIRSIHYLALRLINYQDPHYHQNCKSWTLSVSRPTVCQTKKNLEYIVKLLEI